jgi:hypothetical protein
MGIGSTVGKIVEGVKGSKGLFRKMAKDEEKSALYQHLLPYQLSTKVKVGVVGAIGASQLIDSSVDSRKLASLGGKIEAGSARMSGMTDSVQLSRGIQRMQKGKYAGQDPTLTNDGVSGDIVFAMHNMR